MVYGAGVVTSVARAGCSATAGRADCASTAGPAPTDLPEFPPRPFDVGLRLLDVATVVQLVDLAGLVSEWL